MAPILYSIDPSPPCRAVLMLAKAIGLELDVKIVNLLEGEHLEPKFIKMNPEHTLPTFNEDGFILWDSHAINLYLLGKYAKNDSLYPKDLKKRAIVDQRLYFDSATAFSQLLRIGRPIRLKQTKEVPENLKAEVLNTFGLLEAFLESNKWMCGDSPTVADIQLVATVSSVQYFVPLTDKYPNVKRWLNNCAKEPWYEANIKGLNDFNTLFTTLINS